MQTEHINSRPSLAVIDWNNNPMTYRTRMDKKKPKDFFHDDQEHEVFHFCKVEMNIAGSEVTANVNKVLNAYDLELAITPVSIILAQSMHVTT